MLTVTIAAFLSTAYLHNHGLQSEFKGLFYVGTRTALVTAQHILAWMLGSLKLKRRPWLAPVIGKSKTWLGARRKMDQHSSVGLAA